MLSQWWLVLACALGLYMAWTIGANDVANAMGTSVGSRALTLVQAIIVAGVLEFAGAVLVGAYVTDTVRKGIVDPMLFAGDPRLLVDGMLSALAAAAIWLHVATKLGWPVSTTHSIVGAVAGFGIIVAGSEAIQWAKLGQIAASWVVSPLTSGLVGYAIYRLVRRQVTERADPAEAARRNAPLLVGVMAFVLTLVLLFKGLKNLKLNLIAWQVLAAAAAVALLSTLLAWRFGWRGQVRRRSGHSPMEQVFCPLQVVTASFVAFAHGANDVANAVGPVAAVISTIGSGSVAQQVPVPWWILVGGGFGIVIGLASYGSRVMRTIGSRITEITPSRGFAAEFGAAVTILLGSKLGLPLSTTHTLVGAVIGVGFAGGIRALNLAVIRGIVASWILTIPFAGVVCVLVFKTLRYLF